MLDRDLAQVGALDRQPDRLVDRGLRLPRADLASSEIRRHGQCRGPRHDGLGDRRLRARREVDRGDEGAVRGQRRAGQADHLPGRVHQHEPGLVVDGADIRADQGQVGRAPLHPLGQQPAREDGLDRRALGEAQRVDRRAHREPLAVAQGRTGQLLGQAPLDRPQHRRIRQRVRPGQRHALEISAVGQRHVRGQRAAQLRQPDVDHAAVRDQPGARARTGAHQRDRRAHELEDLGRRPRVIERLRQLPRRRGGLRLLRLLVLVVRAEQIASRGEHRRAGDQGEPKGEPRRGAGQGCVQRGGRVQTAHRIPRTCAARAAAQRRPAHRAASLSAARIRSLRGSLPAARHAAAGRGGICRDAGAGGGIRTLGLRFTKPLLYH